MLPCPVNTTLESSLLHNSRLFSALPSSATVSFLFLRFSALVPASHRRYKFRITATPLECAFTNRDVRKPFRIRFYKNCRVSPGSASPFLKDHLNSQVQFFFTPSEPQKTRPVFSIRRSLFHFTYALTPLFVTLTKNAGVYPNSSQKETRHSLLCAAAFSNFSAPPNSSSFQSRLTNENRLCYTELVSGKLVS